MARRLSISPRRYDSPEEGYCLNMDLPDEKDVNGISLGEEIEVVVRGKVVGLDAESEEPDYSYDPPKGQKRKMRKVPARMELEITDDPAVRGIQALNDALINEDD